MSLPFESLLLPAFLGLLPLLFLFSLLSSTEYLCFLAARGTETNMQSLHIGNQFKSSPAGAGVPSFL